MGDGKLKNASSAQPVEVVSRPLAAVGDETQRRLKALAYGLEFTKRCFEARTLQDLNLLLTNDISALVEFDRAFLVLHLGGRAELAAASNTVVLEKKARFHTETEAIGSKLAGFDRGVLISAGASVETLKENGLSEDAIATIKSYIEWSKCAHLFALPLNHAGKPMGHLLLEFFPGRAVDETRMVALLSLAPLLASALAQKWLLARRPGLASLLAAGGGSPVWRWMRRVMVVAALAAAIGYGLFAVPVELSVGGEAEIMPHVRHMAFSQAAGLVEKVLVKEGEAVRAGQTIAVLDPRDVEYRLKAAERQIEIYDSEMESLQRAAVQGQASKLAERDLVALKKKQAEAERAYLKTLLGQLAIKAPVAGTVVTRDIASMAGRKLAAGEMFCELVAAGDLSVDVFVPEDRTSLVKPGQALTLYLDADPRTGHPLVVEEVAPRADVVARLGNVFRVRARFSGAGPHVMVGMKGIGKISVREAPLYELIRDRVVRSWRRLSLHLS
jgi:biotin carboxyl carrier protein